MSFKKGAITETGHERLLLASVIVAHHPETPRGDVGIHAPCNVRMGRSIRSFLKALKRTKANGLTAGRGRGVRIERWRCESSITSGELKMKVLTNRGDADLGGRRELKKWAA